MNGTIGIIGHGVVGGAVVNGLVEHVNIYVYDIKKEFDTLETTVNESDILFICVPTYTVNNKQDLSDIHKCISDINSVAKTAKTIVLKSTVIPGTTRKLSEKYPKHEFIFNPEFLTARTANEDFKNQKQIIIGCSEFTNNVNSVKLLYSDVFPTVPIKMVSLESAELTKYMCNCMYAVKITAANQIARAAESMGISYDEVRDLVVANGWLTPDHLNVPGPDGFIGYGGACLVKDTKAFVAWGKDNDVDLSLFEKTDIINEQIRDE